MSRSKDDLFATTRWSVVLRAGQADTPRAAEALTELCRTYWYPLYVYIRSRGHGSHDAEDLTQGFFAKLPRLESLADVSREKGKFRAFLLAALKNYLIDQWHKASAQKRDQRQTISLDAATAEARYAMEPVDTLTPERLFERQWALTLLDTVMHGLAEEYEQAGRGELFRTLRYSIAGEKNAVPYRDLAAKLNVSEEAVRVAVHRLRKSYRRVLKQEIAHAVTDADEVEDELNSLRRILSET